MKSKLLIITVALFMGISIASGINKVFADAGFAGEKTSENFITRNYLKVPFSTTLELAGNPQKPAISPRGDFILVPAKEFDQLYYITMIKDTPTLQTFNIATGKGPIDVVISNNSHRAYVANELDNSISIIRLDGGESEIVTNIDLGGKPRSIALSPDNKYLYVLNYEQNSLIVIKLDEENSSIVNIIKVGIGPVAIKLSDTGKMAYVVNQGDNTITQIDFTSPEGSIFQEAINVGTYPTDLAINKDDTLVMATNGFSNSISLFNPVEVPSIVFGSINNFAKPFGIVSDSKEAFAVAIGYYTGQIDFYDLQQSSSGQVTALEHDPISIQEKPEFITLNNKAKLITIIHPRKNLLSLIRYDMEKTKIELPQPPEANNINAVSEVKNIKENMEDRLIEQVEEQVPKDDVDEVIKEVLDEKGNPLKGRTRAE